MRKGDRPIIAEEEVRYPVADNESVLDALLAAIFELDLDPYEQDTVLYDWINTDSIDSMNWESNEALMISTVVWGHPIYITKSEITIYPHLTDDQQAKPLH